jgi:hypothetical protein
LKYEVKYSVGGGYALYSNMCPYPESSKNPLIIYSICTVSYQHPEQNFDNAYDTFFNHLHEDVSAMTRIDLDFNIYLDLTIEYRDDRSNVLTRKFQLEEILNNKLRIHAEIKAAVLKRYKISSRLYIRCRDFISWNDNGLRLAHSNTGKLEYSDDFIYVPLEKVYIFHVIEKKQDDVRNISYSHCPRICLLESVFFTKQSAEEYAKFYMSRADKIIQKQNLVEF